MILPRAFYARETVLVAKDLLGKILVSSTQEGITSGKIVETEAYVSDDEASHAFRGQNIRNEAMFKQPGTIYVYLIYGVHYCLNLVTLPGEAVLIRALEPVEGIPLMKQRRQTDSLKMTCNGPGKLAQALHITLQDNGQDILTSQKLSVLQELNSQVQPQIVTTTRVGITKAAHELRRFYFKDSPFISRP